MDRKIIYLVMALGLLLGCAGSVREGKELHASTNEYGPLNSSEQKSGGLTFNPTTDVEPLLPEMSDLPTPAALKKERARKYTGIIKNKTRYDVSVPSGESGATLIIPARGWIEYSSWTRRFDLTAYYNGKPFYCLKIYANPRDYTFMCSKYDFLVEIVKPEPKPRGKAKRAIKKKRKGAETVG